MKEPVSENQDVRKVFEEARQYAASGEYDKALEKHLWIHHHSLEVEPAFAGVRLSYALHHWVALGRVYPPALEALIEIRNDSERRMRTDDGTRDVFIDVQAINRVLSEGSRTYELFKWLHSERAQLSPQVYDIARNDVINAGDYSLCARYLDPKSKLVEMRSLRALYAPGSENHDIMAFDYFTRKFVQDALTLIALLVLNKRSGPAEWTRKQVLLDHDTPEFRSQLDRAMKGELIREMPEF